MRDISKYTPNVQKFIRYDWAAWNAKNDEDFERILKERNKFYKENFTLEDYDSMLEESYDYPPEYQMWKRAKDEYLASHMQNTISKETIIQNNIKFSNK